MQGSRLAAAEIRFGAFVLDVRTGELRKGSARLRVPDQSVEVLKALLERPGELVTREELRQRLWPDDTFVDFEQGLNGIVRRLRDALGDSADAPRFIETLPRRGYRFIGRIEASALPDSRVTQSTPGPAEANILRRWRPRYWQGVLVVLLTIGAALVWTATGRRHSDSVGGSPPKSIPVTSLPGACLTTKKTAAFWSALRPRDRRRSEPRSGSWQGQCLLLVLEARFWGLAGTISGTGSPAVDP